MKAVGVLSHDHSTTFIDLLINSCVQVLLCSVSASHGASACAHSVGFYYCSVHKIIHTEPVRLNLG